MSVLLSFYICQLIYEIIDWLIDFNKTEMLYTLDLHQISNHANTKLKVLVFC